MRPTTSFRLAAFAPQLLCAAAVLLMLLACTEPSSAVMTAGLRCTAQTTSRVYFGLDSPQGPVSDTAWQDFVDSDITPRLPEGFTWLAAKGQWRSPDGVIRREDSRVLEVVAEDNTTHRQLLAEIAGRYKTRFAQQAVLVTQSATRVCA
jgi:Protein of unknown function (DUF3574)